MTTEVGSTAVAEAARAAVEIETDLAKVCCLIVVIHVYLYLRILFKSIVIASRTMKCYGVTLTIGNFQSIT